MSLTRVRSNDRGSLPLVLLVITIGLGMSALLAPLVVRQVQSTRVTEDRNTALNAAQAGLDSVMARVRAASAFSATSATLEGLLENLPPCSFEGDAGVSGVGESMKYTVKIVYRDRDDNPLACDPSRPDYGPTKVPTRADLTVTGVSRQIVRRLTATYVFTTSNTNIPGGQIRNSVQVNGVDMCLDAGPAKSPAAGTAVTMQPCNGTSRQQFGYTSDLYLKLVNSESAQAEYGMCLTAADPHSTATSVVVFQPCPNTTKPTSIFQWSLDGSSRFKATSAAGKTETMCMTVTTRNLVGSKVGLGDCKSTNPDIWRSAAGVGGGMSGDTTNQMVNFAQFSRCLDVTDQDVNKSYMIAWFCKQSPNGVVDWNQRWYHPVPVLPEVFKTGNITITKDTNPTSTSVWYCLKSPLSTAANAYPTLVLCKGNETMPATQWTVYHDTGDYATSYRVTDSKGYCLTPTDLNATPKDVHTDGTSKIKVAVCSNSELQKWNAPPNLNKPTPLTDLNEQ
ncbi:ricin-type beta-trefoil lectin domain protein [Actinoplanes sp. URMC 104]|uniref:ricin-type beta-trefoil lectin domain protein n=1 Tax=Actinoplanes sp. URMC 104 TaxID=3423409 RepID=UPI003F1AAAB6